MTSQIYIKNFNTNTSPMSYSLRDIQKKAVQSKNSTMKQTFLIQQYKTSIISQVPQINLSRLSPTQKLKFKKTMTSRSPARNIVKQKTYPLHTERKQFPIKKILTPNTQNTPNKTKAIQDLKDTIIPNNIVWKKKNGDLQKLNLFNNVQTVSNNFLQSFRVIFSELVQVYFLQIYLRKKLKHLKLEIWAYILKNAGLQIGDKKQKIHYSQIDSKKFSLGIKTIVGNEFKLSQIENMMNKHFLNKSVVIYSQFQSLLNLQNDFIDFLIEGSYEKKYGSLNISKLVNLFLKSLIEFTDLQRKIQLICAANQNQVIKFVFQISSGQALRISKLACFLQEININKQMIFGVKLTQAKLTNFLDKILNKKLTKYELIKWLKLHEKLIQ